MGKSNRVKSVRQEVLELKRLEAERLAEKKRKNTITAIVVSAVCVVLVAAFVLTLVLINNSVKNGDNLRKETVLATENFSVNGATFTYFLNYEYQNFVNNYADNLESYGLDVSIPLRDQETSDGKNWFDYMVERAQASLEELMLLCEKAKAEGFELGDKDQKEMESFFADMEKEAKDNDMALDEYITLLYGQGVKRADIEDGLKISMLATNYYQKTIAEKEYTDKQIDEYYTNNDKDFATVDYKYYVFSSASDGSISGSNLGEQINTAKANADKLMKAKNPEDFDKILTEILKAQDYSESDIKDTLDTTIAEDSTYDKEFSIAVWAFDKDTKLYDTKLYQNQNRYSVYMLTKKPTRDENETRSVRHILTSIDSATTDEEAKKKSEEILAEYNKGEKTAESFAALAEKYTQDPGSQSTGGLYENFAKGQMVAEFEKLGV